MTCSPGLGGASALVHLHDGDDLFHFVTRSPLVAVPDESRGSRWLASFGWVPNGRQGFLSRQQGTPSVDIVAIPEEELKILGAVFHVKEVVHKVVQRAGLPCHCEHVILGNTGLFKSDDIRRLTGSVLFLITSSKESSAGIFPLEASASSNWTVVSTSDIVNCDAYRVLERLWIDLAAYPMRKEARSIL